MKKLLDSDWLGAVQFKCNTSAEICNTDANYIWIYSSKNMLKSNFFFSPLWQTQKSIKSENVSLIKNLYAW